MVKISEPVYEVHITVNTDDIAQFKSDCVAVGVKPILLDLQSRSGDQVQQEVMTSSTFRSVNGYRQEVARITQALFSRGYQIARVKVETSPTHPEVPTSINGLSVTGNHYFESHLRILACDKTRSELAQLCAEHQAHLSRNLLKPVAEQYQIMATLRTYTGVYEDFHRQVQTFQSALIGAGYEVDKVEVEYALFDSNKDHDRSWLEA
jgi:hypothetical protein